MTDTVELLRTDSFPPAGCLLSPAPWPLIQRNDASARIFSMTRSARLFVALGLTLLVGAAGQGRGADKAEAEPGRFFEAQVRPILQAHCLACHGGEKKIKGG